MYGVRHRLMPINYVKCSRHAGSVAAHRRSAATFASARPPCRHPLTVFLRMHFCAIGVRFQLISRTKRSLQADSEGAFFSSESAEKKRTGWVGLSVT